MISHLILYLFLYEMVYFYGILKLLSIACPIQQGLPPSLTLNYFASFRLRIESSQGST